LEGREGFFVNGSEVNGSFFVCFLKKSSVAEPRNGSLSLKGSPPNGSEGIGKTPMGYGDREESPPGDTHNRATPCTVTEKVKVVQGVWREPWKRDMRDLSG
jgi:hypothetical protein